MVDVHAVDMALWGVIVISAVAAGLAAAGIGIAWLTHRRRTAQGMARAVRAFEAGPEDQARDLAA
jgi:hypothetical protein